MAKYRVRVKPRKDARIFRKTADKGKAINLGRITSRGGILF